MQTPSFHATKDRGQWLISNDEQLDHLLNLKQQQASVFQTWQSTKQAEETMRQGRAIIIFTVMTIIFVSILMIPVIRPPLTARKQLPLGFIASIFGMNNKQISGNDMPMTLMSQVKYMCKLQRTLHFPYRRPDKHKSCRLD